MIVFVIVICQWCADSYTWEVEPWTVDICIGMKFYPAELGMYITTQCSVVCRRTALFKYWIDQICYLSDSANMDFWFRLIILYTRNHPIIIYLLKWYNEWLRLGLIFAKKKRPSIDQINNKRNMNMSLFVLNTEFAEVINQLTKFVCE